jgi:hypothetical protein
MNIQNLIKEHNIKYKEKCARYLNCGKNITDEEILLRLDDWKLFESGLKQFNTTDKKKVVCNSGEEFLDPDIPRDEAFDINLKINVEKEAQEFSSKVGI